MYRLSLRLQEAEATGTDILVVPCPGCCVFLSLIKVLTNSTIDSSLPIEFIQRAAGEQPVHNHEKRAWDILAIATNLLLMWSFSAKRFFPRPVEIEEPLPDARRGDVLRIKLLGMLYHSVLVQNPLSKRLVALTVKALIRRYGVYLEKKAHHNRHEPHPQMRR
ncbi:MAG TPA: hypothetical protein ENN34_04430 [Deltaproteobacteria bacterium]|nr:hypothetical protein [Deltaproteobacteria bacterium]